MLYEPKFEIEVRELIRVVKSKVNEKAYVHDLANTKALSRFYLFSIFDLVVGAFGAVRNRSLGAYNVIGRSLVEYFIDLKFIILRNDKELNSLFANYHKLQMYWTIPYLSMDDEILLLERAFKEYIELRFSDELEKSTKKAIDNKTDRWTEVSKALKGGKCHYGTHWSGLSFPKRVEYCKDEHLKRTGEAADYPIHRIMFEFKVLSQYTHPTPHSIAPHFAGIDGSFLSIRAYSDDKLEDAEHWLFLIVDYSAEFFAEVMDAPLGEQLKALIEETVKSSQKLSDYLYDRE